MSDLVFMDTETLGLELDSPIWEFAAIRREPGGQESRLHMFINHNPARMSIDLPESFRADYEKRWQAAKDGSLVAQPHNAALTEESVMTLLSAASARLPGPVLVLF